ncbi:MAG: hypothetical protein ACYS9C_08110 [Planctomycetota bacterium]|jgi:hypothetical protein
MKKTILLAFVFALGLAVKVANGDFTFGTPANLGPIVNSSVLDWGPNVSADGLELFFNSGRLGGSGGHDLWVTTRTTTENEWGSPVNLAPTVNTSYQERASYISANGLRLYFESERPGGLGGCDLWVTTRLTKDDNWRTPENLGPTINSQYNEWGPNVSANGLTIYLGSDRPGGFGARDIWVTTRASRDDDWGTPVNLGPTVNSPFSDGAPSISADGLALFFNSRRPGGSGGADIWLTTRRTADDDWGTPVNLGPTVNSPFIDGAPSISADGLALYFKSDRPGGYGWSDLWQVSVEPVVDLNGDGIVDTADMCIMVDHWGEDYSLCDIGPMPWGDGIVDVQDLIVLAEHLFEVAPPAQ